MPHLRQLLAVALVVAAGCGDAAAPAGPAGTYELSRVNGSALPFLAQEFGAFRIDILSGSLVLRADHTFMGEISSRQTNGSDAQAMTEQVAGEWSVNGATITFSEIGKGAYSGQIEGTRLTALRTGVTFEFVKQ